MDDMDVEPPISDEGAQPPFWNGEDSHNPPEDGAADEDEDYDPSSFHFGEDTNQTNGAEASAIQTEDTAPEPSLPAASVQPKTMGGFIIEDDDEDEEEQEGAVLAPPPSPPPPSQLNGNEGAQSGLGAVAVAEAQDQARAQDDGSLSNIASEPTQDTAAVAPQNAGLLNGSTAAAAATTAATASAPSIAVFAAPVVDDDNDDASAATAAATAAVPAPSIQPHADGDQGKAVSPRPSAAPPPSQPPTAVPSVSATPQPPPTNGSTTRSTTNGDAPHIPTAHQRLPHDKVGRLEDRITNDPKADTQAWWSLVQHYKDKDQIDKVREVYERFLHIFPHAPLVWLPYVRLELEQLDRTRIDTIFSRSLPHLPDVDMWTEYLNYLRRILPLVPSDPTDTNRSTITQAFEAVLDAVGLDPESGSIWREYLDFVKDGPGVVGGNGWQDLQKTDLLRKVYQRSVRSPHAELVRTWKEYDNFELALNKAQGRKNLQEQSPHYMTARTSKMQMDQRIAGLDRSGLPTLPPLNGCEGEAAFQAQVRRWKGWVEWEKEDPLVLKEDEPALWRKRVLYVYRQAVIFMRFYPPMWFEAASWCFEQGTEDMTAQGEEFLEKGVEANPESVLLGLKKADRMERGLEDGNSDEVAVRNGTKVDGVYEALLKALYGLRERMVEREKKGVLAIKEEFANMPPEEQKDDEEEERRIVADEEDDDGDDDDKPVVEIPQTRAEQMQAQIQALQAASKAQLETLKRTISYTWIAKMRAFRRIQGQGMPGKPRKGFRGVFAEARPRGQLSSDVYVASALMEWYGYRDASALKIFERGAKLFPQDEAFVGAYVRFLLEAVGDVGNGRVVFETGVGKIMQGSSSSSSSGGKAGETTSAEEMEKRRRKCRGLFAYMYAFESQYGELAQMGKLEERMREVFPEETDLQRFSRRFAGAPGSEFDGVNAQLVISTTQTRPRTTLAAAPEDPFQPIVSIEHGTPETLTVPSGLRLGPNGPYVASPKRPLEDDDMDGTPRKFMRGESPLKGAAGRRIQSTTVTTTGLGHSASNSTTSGAISGVSGGVVVGGSGFVTKNYIPPGAPGAASAVSMPMPMPMPITSGPPPWPRDLHYLLSILPPASQYRAVLFDPVKTVELIRGVNMERVRR